MYAQAFCDPQRYPLSPALLHCERSDIYSNAGLCGPRVTVGSTTSYSITDTMIEQDCPAPCCTVLEANPLFTCLQTKFPLMASSLCDSGC